MLTPSYTYHYAQPSDYRFSLDSVLMAFAVAQELHLRPDLKDLKMLDLCAGCGIIGFNILFYCPQLASIDFLEIQGLYEPYFKTNLETVRPGIKPGQLFQFLNFNYDQLLALKFAQKYDVIVCNPPYFFVGEGALSPSQFKNRCRFFIDSDFETLVGAVLNALKSGGLAYLLIRPSQQHGRNQIAELNRLLAHQGSLTQLDAIRGTHLIKIQKK